MGRVDRVIQQAERHCKSRGSRLTTKRKQVLMGLVLSNKAVSAYELMDTCKRAFKENLAAMSVYRILDFLEGEGLVHKLKLANKYIACAHITCDHQHAAVQFLICSQCSKVEEVHMSKTILVELDAVVKKVGYARLNNQLEVSGICWDCHAN